MLVAHRPTVRHERCSGPPPTPAAPFADADDDTVLVAFTPDQAGGEAGEHLLNNRGSVEAQEDAARSGDIGRANHAAASGDVRRRISKPEDLAAAIRRVMATRELTTRDVVKRVPRRHVGTVYRLLAGRTTDPWASTIVALCTALGADPDELLDVRDPTEDLDPELRRTLEDLQRLSDDDRWLALDALRAMLARLRPRTE